ncbi:DUF6103 family protein [Massiliimalia massiliensis]|uniref:DUF6103 family protein n=1 Tax=Massiliimalia massiliensis TaxID=1852384 RepID=UPI0009867132|nr:DUF6103 family protein [Massiliimalia massiliensis]
MKKAVIPVSFDAEKLSAAKLYMAQKDLSFEDEMEKAADALYSKYVPAGVREFIELNARNKTAAKPKKPKVVPSSAVGVKSGTDGDSD